MLDRIVKFLERRADAGASKDPFEVKQVAAAALMAEGARLDRDFDSAERDTMVRLVKERFGLAPEEAEELVEIATERAKANYSNWQFANAVKTNFSKEEQADILSMMWEVAYADGSLHRFEVHQILEVAKQLGLSDADVEAARKTAQGRLGM